MENKTNKKQESQTERHVCKICGEQMPPERCFQHEGSTGHSEFRPIFDDFEMKGGNE